MGSDETERVVMLWPKELKAKVRDVAGPRELTSFTIAAVNQHLNVSPDLDQVTTEVIDLRELVQELADQLVLGGPDRLQTFMELDLPDWVDTSGWPAAFSERVRPSEEEQTPEDDAAEEALEVINEVVEIAEASSKEEEEILSRAAKSPTVHRERERLPELEHDEIRKEAWGEPDPKRDDLFAKVMAKAGGKLDDVPGLKLASDIEAPEKDPNACPKCGEDLVDGECWTCG